MSLLSSSLPQRISDAVHLTEEFVLRSGKVSDSLADLGNMVWRAGRSGVRRKKEAIVTLHDTPPADSVVICMDEMGPECARSYPGTHLVRIDPAGDRWVRATQEIDYGRRGKGYVFGAFEPATGAAFTAPFARRTTANWVDSLNLADAWVDPVADRMYTVQDNLSIHRTVDVLLWSLPHSRREFVFQPRYAASLNLIKPWWKILRSLALTGRCLETRDGAMEGDRACHSVLECTPVSVHLGAAEAASLPITSSPWHRMPSCYHLNMPDGPLS